MTTPLEQLLEQKLAAIEPELFALRRRVVELEEENRRLKALLPVQAPPTPAPPASGFAFGIADAQGTREVTVPGNFAKIGTHASCALKIDGARLMHAAIERDGAQVTLIDLGTQEGTRVNGAPVTKAVLKPGDVIGIGSAQIVVAFRP